VMSDYERDKRHCRLIQRHYLFLLDELQTKYSQLLAHLYQNKVLRLDEKELVQAELTSTRQNEKLLSILSRKTPEQFEAFCKALNNTGHEHVAERLTNDNDCKAMCHHRMYIVITSYYKLFF